MRKALLETFDPRPTLKAKKVLEFTMNIHSRDVDKEIERSEARPRGRFGAIAEKGADALDGPHLTARCVVYYPQRTRNFA